jgi:hypothetical protein
MFRRLVARPLLVGLLLAGVTGAAVAWANADALAGADVQALVPSGLPSLLGPIDEHGRIGWECKPERAAGAKHANAGELPQAQP